MTDRLLHGRAGLRAGAVVDGPVQVRLTEFGRLGEGMLNVSKVKTGRVTLCRLASRGDQYRMHIVTGEAVRRGPGRGRLGAARAAAAQPGGRPRWPVDEFAQKVLGQHYILAYGDQRRMLGDCAGCWGLL